MKALLIGSLAIILVAPGAAAAPVLTATAAKFGTSVQLNYTRGVAPRAGYGYRGGYRGRGYYGYNRGWYGGRYPYYGYRYPYYGYRYPYWGGYYGYPYAAALGFGLGIPLAYYSGYNAGAYAPRYAVYQPTVYARERRVRSRSSGSGGTFVTGVQGALKTRGYYDGSVDGVFGPQSVQALTAFQHANNLSETGLLDAPSLNALGVSFKAPKQSASSAKRPAAPPPRQPTSEGTFVPPPIDAPVEPPGIPAESAPAPAEPPPIPAGSPAQ